MYIIISITFGLHQLKNLRTQNYSALQAILHLPEPPEKDLMSSNSRWQNNKAEQDSGQRLRNCGAVGQVTVKLLGGKKNLAFM